MSGRITSRGATSRRLRVSLPPQLHNNTGELELVKASKSVAPPIVVRTRRAYFDCKFGQLHVRTAFPTTGGFDEQVTLICLHPIEGSSRTFGRLLTELADVRSVYAPDLPGHGESDPSPSRSIAEAATAVSDLSNDLRLRQIDLLGIHYGAGVALELAAARPELVRKLVLAGVPAADRSNPGKQQRLIINSADYGNDFDAAAHTLAKQISAFLRGHARLSGSQS
jgi:pimeloyl-ACP methyl ester carboxylesterase